MVVYVSGCQAFITMFTMCKTPQEKYHPWLIASFAIFPLTNIKVTLGSQ